MLLINKSTWQIGFEALDEKGALGFNIRDLPDGRVEVLSISSWYIDFNDGMPMLAVGDFILHFEGRVVSSSEDAVKQMTRFYEHEPEDSKFTLSLRRCEVPTKKRKTFNPVSATAM